MPPVPSSNLTAVNNLAGNFPESPARVGLVVGPSELGIVNSIVRDDSINTVLSEFGAGPASEEAAGALNEPNHGAVYQIKSASSVAGTVSSVTKISGATVGSIVNDFGDFLSLGVDFNGNVLFKAKIAGAQVQADVGGSETISTVGLVTSIQVTSSSTGTSLAALVNGDAGTLVNWGVTATGTGASVCMQGWAIYDETAGRIGFQALTGSMQVRNVIAGSNTARSVALTGGTIVDLISSTNSHGEPTSTGIQFQSDLVALAIANPGKFRSTLAGSGMGILGAKTLTNLPFGSSGTMTVSGAPFDGYQVSVQIVTGGALGAASFRLSLGKSGTSPIYGGNTYLIPSGGIVTIADTGLTLTFSGTFDSGDLFSFTTTAPQSTLSDILSALTYFLSRPEMASLITIAGEIALVDLPAWISALGIAADQLENAKKYCRILIEFAGPTTGQTNAAWAALVTSALSAYSHPRLSLFGGEANASSALPLPQAGRPEVVNGNRTMFARALALPSGVDVGDQTLSGGMTGVISGLQTDVASSLAAARASYLYLLSSVPGVQCDFLLFDSPTGDFTYGVYGRVLDEGMFYGALGQVKYLNTAQRRAPNGTIDPGSALAIERDLRNILVQRMVKPGNVNDVTVVVDRTNTDTRLIITYRFQILFYIKTIDGRAGIVQTITATQTL